MTEVTAAIFKNKQDEILICQRPAGKNCALLWEFPGGKQEPGETLEECIVRECIEELSVEIKVLQKFDEVTHEYNDKTVHITFFECVFLNGVLMKKEHNDIKWVNIAELQRYEFCPADKLIVEKIISNDNNLS
jgi:8-oxo-dGTP diphosphatase